MCKRCRRRYLKDVLWDIMLQIPMTFFHFFFLGGLKGEESKENKLSKSQLSSKINILEAENKRLRNDLKLYKTMHVIIEGMLFTSEKDL